MACPAAKSVATAAASNAIALKRKRASLRCASPRVVAEEGTGGEGGNISKKLIVAEVARPRRPPKIAPEPVTRRATGCAGHPRSTNPHLSCSLHARRGRSVARPHGRRSMRRGRRTALNGTGRKCTSTPRRRAHAPPRHRR
eukprot:355474-Chlamydomonas_euryale.AAC.1